MIQLYIARHGNTFDKGDTVLRVGCRTDLPLSSSGRAQASELGNHFASQELHFDEIYTSQLKRTKETAELICEKLKNPHPYLPMNQFNEVDYGPDEGKPESEVIARIGEKALKEWEEKNTVPTGWLINPSQIEAQWQDFADELIQKGSQTVLVVTSNGVARFASSLLRIKPAISETKLSTGAYGCYEYAGSEWIKKIWNKRP